MTMFQDARALAVVLRDPGLSPRRLEALVQRRLERVLRAALAVPWYAKLYQRTRCHAPTGGLRPESLARLPIVTRAMLNEAGKGALVRPGTDLTACHVETSSGSSGVPLAVYRNSYERSVQVAKWLRVLIRNGYRPHHRVTALVRREKLEKGRRLLSGLGLFRRQTLDYSMPIDSLADAVLRERPRVLYGNRCHLELVADVIDRRGMRCNGLNLLVATGEVIHEGSRRFMEEIYGTKVVESYGSVEMGVMAHQLPNATGLYLCEDRTVFEFLDEEGRAVPPGVPGRVVVTDLTNTLMPLVRYDQGDLAEYRVEQSPRGRPTRVITRILGRDDDYAVMPDGSLRTYLDFCGFVAGIMAVRQFRLTQLTPVFFRMEVVAARQQHQRIRSSMESFVASELPGCSFQTVFRDRIEPDPSGKIRKFVSLVHGGAAERGRESSSRHGQG